MYFHALNWLNSFIKKDEGVTAIEYGLIAALIAVIIIAALTLVGFELDKIFGFIAAALQNANAS